MALRVDRIWTARLRGCRLAGAAALVFAALALPGRAQDLRAVTQQTPSGQPAAPAASLPPPAAADFAGTVPPRPANPRAAKAYATFDTYCARCHQTGRLDMPLPAGGLGNILALGDVARRSALVTPGVPDASALYDVLANAHAPLDVLTSRGADGVPGADEVSAVRDWIRDLPGTAQQCAGRKHIRASEIDTWVEEALRAERERAREVRFVSLVNLYNACASSAEMAAARQAVGKLLNSLSWAPQAQRFTAVDPHGTLIAFRLPDLAWSERQWDVLVKAYPKALVAALSDRTRRSAGAANPIVRGDWLAAALSDAKLYYELLGIPPSLTELAEKAGVDVDAGIRAFRARRALVRDSAVTRGNRMAERHSGATGGFWLIYDFATSKGDQDLIERPLGPGGRGVRTPFRADGVRALFGLPNGFLAYALFDAAGTRVDRVSAATAKQIYPAAAALERAGLGCFGCHALGIKPVRDAYRAHVQSQIDALARAQAEALAQAEAEARAKAQAQEPAQALAQPPSQAAGNPPPPAAPADAALAAAPPNPPVLPPDDIRDTALQLSASDGEMKLLSDADNERYRNALIAAGIDRALTFDGAELVTGLARRYEEGTDYAGAAIELGLDTETLDTALANAPAAIADLALHLRQGRRPRDQIDRLFAYLKNVEPPATAKAQPSAASNAQIGLTLWVDKPRPGRGDLIRVNAAADTDCYLTLINVDPGGRATVVFPNDFEPDNLIAAGRPAVIPRAESQYQLRRKEEGRELIVARCSTSPAPPTGIEHEFSRQRFTVLGDWEAFIADVLITEADLRRNPQKVSRARVVRAQAARRDSGRSSDRADTAPGRTLADGRAVVVIE